MIYIGKKKTNEQFINEIVEKDIPVIPLDPYINDRTKIHVKCKRCGYVYMATPSNLLRRKGCKQCANINMRKERLKPNSVFLSELQEVNPDIDVLEEYKGAYVKLKCRCRIHGTEGYIDPSHLLRGQTHCRICSKHKNVKATTKTHTQFITELSQINQDIEVLGTYINSHTKVKVQCKKCGNVWEANPSYLLSSNAHCVRCSRTYSYGEDIIATYLQDNGLEYILHKTFDDLKGVGGKSLSYDFYIPQRNILLEYQGQYHDGTGGRGVITPNEYRVQQIHDQRKREYSLLHGYSLKEIWYYEDINGCLNEIFDKNPVTITV